MNTTEIKQRLEQLAFRQPHPWVLLADYEESTHLPKGIAIPTSERDALLADVRELLAEVERLEELRSEDKQQAAVEYQASENLRAQLAAAEERVKELEGVTDEDIAETRFPTSFQDSER